MTSACGSGRWPQRITALLAIGPSFDALYQDAAAIAFTAEELQIVR
jgi:hypothetical protein